MEQRDERTAEARPSKRKYEAPQIVSQQVFETTALACMKVAGGGGCGASPKS